MRPFRSRTAGRVTLVTVQHIFGRYQLDARTQHLYARCGLGVRHAPGVGGGSGLFRSVDRLKLLNSILGAPLTGGCGMDISQLSPRALRAAFPLRARDKAAVAHRWIVQFAFNAQPFDAIKDYFGEKIAMYLHYRHYTTCPPGRRALASWAAACSGQQK